MSTISPNKFQRFIIKRVGVDKYVEEWEKNKSAYTDLNMNDDSEFEHKENKVWYIGNTQKLEHFYKEHRGAYMINQYKFWRVVHQSSNQMPRLHYPLASTITNTMGTLLFNKEVEFTVDAGAKSRNKSIQERIDTILETNDMQVLLQEAARQQSYSGAVGLKMNYDPTLTDVPLITTYAKEDFKVERKYNQIIYIDFFDYYDGGYKLVSRYGNGYINYLLYRDKTRVSLSDLEQTANLKDIAFFDEDGLMHNYMFATAIGNKTKEGVSDYNGLVDSFHALDETYSTLLTYIRRTKPNIFITEDIAKKDKQGRPLPLDEFDNVVTILDQAIGDNATKIERSIEEIKIEGYKDTLDKLRNTVLERIGISPATIGIDGAGAAASGEALRLRERASIKTRGEKLALWDESLEKFIIALYNFDILTKESEEPQEGIRINNTVIDFDLSINFGDYIEETLSDRVITYVNLYEKGAISIEFLQMQLFGRELSEDELMRLTIETKMQQNFPLNKLQEDWLQSQPEYKVEPVEEPQEQEQETEETDEETEATDE